jgi:hypothetical protein
VGGVVGEHTHPEHECSLLNATASGDVSGVGETIGGVVGSLSGHACEVGSTGKVSGKSLVGGVMGTLESNSSCTGCFASGEVQAVGGLTAPSTSSGIGGLVGLSTGSGTLQNSIFTGNISTSTSGTNHFGGITGAAMVTDDDPMITENNLMLGSIAPENGGLVIGTLFTDGLVGEVVEFYANNVYVDHNPGVAPSMAYGEGFTATTLYWAEEVDLSTVALESVYPSTFDFDSTWTMATTIDADSPMYGRIHPVLGWQCDHDPSISCDTAE